MILDRFLTLQNCCSTGLLSSFLCFSKERTSTECSEWGTPPLSFFFPHRDIFSKIKYAGGGSEQRYKVPGWWIGTARRGRCQQAPGIAGPPWLFLNKMESPGLAGATPGGDWSWGGFYLGTSCSLTDGLIVCSKTLPCQHLTPLWAVLLQFSADS